MDTGITFILLAVYGAAVSWLAERFGGFEQLSPTYKQFWIAVATFGVPLVASWLRGQPWWQAGFAEPDWVLWTALVILAPAFSWLAGQLAHYGDLWLSRVAKPNLY